MTQSSHMYGTVVPGRCDCKAGDVVASRYTVEKVLGKGSFGVVYKVKDSDEKPWALKLLRLWDVPSSIRQSLIGRFEMEYKTSCIKSNNLVHSVDCGYLNGNPYIVMEFCPGGDLTQMIGGKDVSYVRIAKDILNGLHVLHVNGKVHRDLKPENVLFKEDGTAVLTDFGISGDRNKRMTELNIFGRPTQVFGTYAYMPPEQVSRARGNSTVLPTTDLYSFGVLMYRLITGVLPFGKLEGPKDLIVYQKRGKEGQWDRMRLLSTPVGRDWEKLISCCLVPDFKKRVSSAKEAIALIPRASHEFGTVVKPVDAPIREIVQQNSQSQQVLHRQSQDKCLTIMHGKEFGKVYNLTKLLQKSGKSLLTIGRGEDNSIVIADYEENYMSRKHCTIENVGNTYWQIRDGQWDCESGVWRNSTNGTYVNSDVVETDGKLLKNGDIITIGDVKLKYDCENL